MVCHGVDTMNTETGKMAAKPLTTAAIAMTEKKMDMSLDDIIKMSKNATGISKAKKPRIPTAPERLLAFHTCVGANEERLTPKWYKELVLRSGRKMIKAENAPCDSEAPATTPQNVAENF